MSRNDVASKSKIIRLPESVQHVIISHAMATTLEVNMYSYHLFGRLDSPEIICATRDDFPLATFLRAPAWQYIETVHKTVLRKLCGRGLSKDLFDRKGFYIFQLIEVPHEMRAATRRESDGRQGSSFMLESH